MMTLMTCASELRKHPGSSRSGQAYTRSRPKGRGTKAPSRLDLGRGGSAEVGSGGERS